MTIHCPTTDEDVRSYCERGYIQYPTFFSPDELTALRAAMEHACTSTRERIKGAPGGGRASEEYERALNQKVNLWTDYPEAKAITFHPRLAEAARRLSGARSVRLYHDHALVKPGGEISKATNWHQDSPFWPMEPQGALSAWIAVDDVDENNGCMSFIPHSHRFGKLEAIPLGVDGASIVTNMKARGQEVAEPVAMPMRAGGVTFHHGCTFHYATPNRTDRPRWAFAVIYIPDYVRFTGGSDPAGAAGEMTPGGSWEHPLHPLLAGE